MDITKAKIGSTYIVDSIGGREKVQRFLLSLGCYPGERITLVNILAGNYIITIKDSRFALDQETAQAVTVKMD